MSRKYKMHDPNGIYFLSFATVGWVDALTRPIYKNVIIDSLKHCIENKGLLVHAYVIMTNHVHLVISRTEDGQALPDIVRDFKKFTSSTLLRLIKNNKRESRRAWMLSIFREYGQKNSNNTKYQFWQQHNQPMIVYSPKIIRQKIDYIHNNPVVEEYVTNGSSYPYSSCATYVDERIIGKLRVDLLDAYYSF